MNFHVQPLFHFMDATAVNGITRTKLWKSEQNFGRPHKTLEEFFSKIFSIVAQIDYCISVPQEEAKQRCHLLKFISYPMYTLCTPHRGFLVATRRGEAPFLRRERYLMKKWNLSPCFSLFVFVARDAATERRAELVWTWASDEKI